MSNIRIYLLTGLKIPRLQVGPTLESPGPMLFKVAAIAKVRGQIKVVNADEQQGH